MQKDISGFQFTSLTWALIVGVNHYREPTLGKLDTSIRDARRLANALIAPEGCSVPEAQVKLITGENGLVSRDDFWQTFKTSLLQIPKHALLIVYFAGHGLVRNNQFHLCFSDTDTDLLQQTSVTSSDLDILLKRIPARGVLVILDCCQGAGFAESAPAFFRNLGESDFRILLSSSKSGERSWEIPSIGSTIFCNLLCNVLEGKDVVGKKPGEIYFSDLLHYLHFQLQEEVKFIAGDAIMQTPVFSGVYSRDPLLFVHRELTFKQIKFKTNRYSPQYLRRIIIRLSFLFLGAIIFFIGSWYYILEHTEYVDEQGGYLSVFVGHPRYNAFGFPKLLWSSDLPAESINKPNYSLPIISQLGRPVLSELLKGLRPPRRQHLLWRLGQMEVAKSELFSFISKEGNIASEWYGEAVQLFSKLAEDEDIGILINLTKIDRVDIQIGAYQGLLQIDPDLAIDLLLQQAPLANRGFHREILNSIEKGNREKIGQLLSRLLRVPGMKVSFDLIFDVALRFGIQLSMDDLWVALIDDMYIQSENVPNYVIQSNLLEYWLEDILDRLNDSPDSFELTRIFYALSKIPSATINQDFTVYITEELDFESNMIATSAAIAALKHKQVIFSELPSYLRHDTFLLQEVKKMGMMNSDIAFLSLEKVAASEAGIAEILSLLVSVDGYLDERSVPSFKKWLSYEDENDIPSSVHSAALDGLCKIDPVATSEYISLFLSSELTEAAKVAHRCLAKSDRNAAIDALVARIDHQDADYVTDLLVEMDIGVLWKQTLLGMLDESPLIRERVAAVLIVNADVELAVKLLTSPFLEVRTNALEFVAANEDLKQIYNAVKDEIKYPDFVTNALAIQITLKEKIINDVIKLPDSLRTWRLKLMFEWRDITEGLRIWYVNKMQQV